MTEAWTVTGFSEVRELGEGPSGRVVAAVDDVTGTPAVIKHLSADLLGDPDFGRRFAAEIRLLAQIEDPNLVQVIADVETQRGHAIVMEQVNGVSLREMLRGLGPLGPLAALVVLSHSLAGLAAAHKSRVLHRDYRPENVLVDSTGLCKLVDLGLAVPAGGAYGIVGHPSYAAPELWSGAAPSASSDVYAATAVFFECLTGRRPYRSHRSSESRAMAALAKAHREEPIPIEAVPGPMHNLLRLGMAKDPADRPSAADLLAYLDDTAVSAYGPSWESQGRSRLVEIGDLIAGSPPPPARKPSPRRSPRSTASFQHAAPPSAGGHDVPGTGRDVRQEAPASAAHRPGGIPSVYGSPPEDGAHHGVHRAEAAASAHAEPDDHSDHSDHGGTGTGRESVSASGHGSGQGSDPGSGDGRGARDGSARGGRGGGHAAAPDRPSGRFRDWQIGAAAAVFAVLAGFGLHAVYQDDRPRDTVPSARHDVQSAPPSTGPGPDQAGAPETAAALGDRIGQATAARPSASFVYRDEGGTGTAGADATAAKGTFKVVARGASPYDLTAWNPTPRSTRSKPVRVVLIGVTANVKLATWRTVAANGAGAGRGDESRDYAAMAAEARWATSVAGITALLNSSTSLKRTGLVYRGTASMPKLLRTPTVAPLFRPLALGPGEEQVGFVIEVTKDYLPRRIQITVTAKGKPATAARVLRVKYAGWGRPVTIEAPRPTR